MKAITMRIQKFSRPGVILMATVVAIITSIVVANATQSITAPNAAFISYSLAAGANSAAITPASNRAVLVMGVCTTSGGGVGHVSLQHSPSSGGVGGAMTWAGLESFSGFNSTITSGENSTAGTHIVYIDYNHKVDVQVNSADTIVIHNGQSSTMARTVTLVW